MAQKFRTGFSEESDERRRPVPWLLAIIDEYGMTKSSNLSHYYAGMCFLKLGQFENAVEQLKKFSGGDKVIGPLAKGGLGDAYVELKDISKGIGYYTDAADQSKNEFLSHIFL